MTNIKTKRTENKSFYHYVVTKKNDEGNVVGDLKYYYTHKDLKEDLGIPRPTLYRMVKYPEKKCKYKFKIEKIYLHTSVVDYINSSSETETETENE